MQLSLLEKNLIQLIQMIPLMSPKLTLGDLGEFPCLSMLPLLWLRIFAVIVERSNPSENGRQSVISRNTKFFRST